MTIKANCKINIGLDILERRTDGFHNISTLMYPVMGLYDLLEITPLTTANVEFTGKGLLVDCPASDNLCVKAYHLMARNFAGVGGVSITLDKRVPFGAGLGGGSSDATAVLKAIDSLYNLSLSPAQLTELAAELGSDTPFFVNNSPCLCTSRGEVMHSVNLSLSGYYLTLIKPQVNVPTALAYAGVRPAHPTTPLEQLLQLPLEQWQGRIKNDFEPHIFAAHPLLSVVKEDLLAAGALYAAMSGSGSSIYGIFKSEQQAKSEQLESYSPYILAL